MIGLRLLYRVTLVGAPQHTCRSLVPDHLILHCFTLISIHASEITGSSRPHPPSMLLVFALGTLSTKLPASQTLPPASRQNHSSMPCHTPTADSITYMVEDIFESIVSDRCKSGWVVTIPESNWMMDALEHTSQSTEVDLGRCRLHTQLNKYSYSCIKNLSEATFHIEEGERNILPPKQHGPSPFLGS